MDSVFQNICVQAASGNAQYAPLAPLCTKLQQGVTVLCSDIVGDSVLSILNANAASSAVASRFVRMAAVCPLGLARLLLGSPDCAAATNADVLDFLRIASPTKYAATMKLGDLCTLVGPTHFRNLLLGKADCQAFHSVEAGPALEEFLRAQNQAATVAKITKLETACEFFSPRIGGEPQMAISVLAMYSFLLLNAIFLIGKFYWDRSHGRTRLSPTHALVLFFTLIFLISRVCVYSLKVVMVGKLQNDLLFDVDLYAVYTGLLQGPVIFLFMAGAAAIVIWKEYLSSLCNTLSKVDILLPKVYGGWWFRGVMLVLGVFGTLSGALLNSDEAAAKNFRRAALYPYELIMVSLLVGVQTRSLFHLCHSKPPLQFKIFAFAYVNVLLLLSLRVLSGILALELDKNEIVATYITGVAPELGSSLTLIVIGGFAAPPTGSYRPDKISTAATLQQVISKAGTVAVPV
eukprot:CAMPEP_0184664000 /NCGR_PEP_ID=MMETSP0308-20130426/50759_1 /TAXON_ID=38269 /ORGANISM="Gloeochaete witrockiana, Strain SAG 46.84" /LENGTH=460 /DNA_ID=CAMNT_0027107117 /DNA_START=127 /DNA_END=1509 /DNA_ORIENTATION=-